MKSPTNGYRPKRDAHPHHRDLPQCRPWDGGMVSLTRTAFRFVTIRFLVPSHLGTRLATSSTWLPSPCAAWRTSLARQRPGRRPSRPHPPAYPHRPWTACWDRARPDEFLRWPLGYHAGSICPVGTATRQWKAWSAGDPLRDPIGPPPRTVDTTIFEMWLGSLSTHRGLSIPAL